MNRIADAQIASTQRSLNEYAAQCQRQSINQYTKIIGMEFIELPINQSTNLSMDDVSMSNRNIPCVIAATQHGGLYVFDVNQQGEKSLTNSSINQLPIIRPISAYELGDTQQTVLINQSSDKPLILTGGETLNIFSIDSSVNQPITISLTQRIDLPSPMTHVQSVNQSSFVSAHVAGQLLYWTRLDQSINQSHSYHFQLLTRFKSGVKITGLAINQSINQSPDCVFVSDSRGSIHAISLIDRQLKRDILSVNQPIDHLAFDPGMSAIVYVTRTTKSGQLVNQSVNHSINQSNNGSTITAHHWPTLALISSVNHSQSINALQWPYVFDPSPAMYNIHLTSINQSINRGVDIDRLIDLRLSLDADGDAFCVAGESAYVDVFRSRAIKSATLVCQQ